MGWPKKITNVLSDIANPDLGSDFGDWFNEQIISPGTDAIGKLGSSGEGRRYGRFGKRTYNDAAPVTAGLMKPTTADDMAREQAGRDREFSKRQVAEEARARGQISVRVRRGLRDRPNTKNGTLLNGSLGIPGEGYGSFAQLLGLYDGRV